jgi:hypothetical protein
MRNLYENDFPLDVVPADPVERAAAAFVAVSFSRKEVKKALNGKYQAPAGKLSSLELDGCM